MIKNLIIYCLPDQQAAGKSAHEAERDRNRNAGQEAETGNNNQAWVHKFHAYIL